MVRVLIRRMVDHEPWWAEWWSAVAAIGWCLFVLARTDGLASYEGFRMMLAVAPPWAWYASSLALPAGQLWALRRDGRRARWWLAFAMAWWWTFVGLGVAMHGIVVPSLWFYIVFAGMNLNSVYRLRPKGH